MRASVAPSQVMHAAPENVWGQMLSPRFLDGRCRELDDELGCVPCLACHHQGGTAPVRAAATHPDVLMMNASTPDELGYLPLFNMAGHEDLQGQVVCRTCHISHGRLDLLRRRADDPDMTPEEQHALRMQVRPFLPPNVCTTCHGEEARARYLFFHDPHRFHGNGGVTAAPH